jgi:hypothetical protein
VLKNREFYADLKNVSMLYWKYCSEKMLLEKKTGFKPKIWLRPKNLRYS